MSAVLNVPIPSIQELQQNTARLLQEALAQAAQASSAAALSPFDLELARSNIKALAFVQAMGLHGTYRYLRDFIARQAVPIFSSGDFLRGWLATYKMSFKVASKAQGVLHGTGVAGAPLPAGTLLQTATGLQIKVSADTVVAGDGSITANAIAALAGAATLQAGATLTLVSPVDGIDATFTAADGWLPGTDDETEDQAIYRLQQRLSFAPMGGAPGDYARWALSVAGITRAWGLRNPAGPTSAGVIVMADGNPSGVSSYGLPTTAQRQAVADYISDPFRGPPDELFVYAPTPVVIAPNLSITPDTPAMRAAITASLKDLFFREAVPGGSIPHGHLIAVVSEVAGEYNHTWNSPAITQGATFTVPSFLHLLVLDDPVFS